MTQREEFLRRLERWNRQFTKSHRPVWEKLATCAIWGAYAVTVVLLVVLLKLWGVL